MLAYAGAPAGPPPNRNSFFWTFSNPFQNESAFITPNQQVPTISDDTPIFVREFSNDTLSYRQVYRDSLAIGAGLRSIHLNPDHVKVLPPTPTCPRPTIAPVVLLHLPNCLPLIPLFLGTIAADLTPSLVSPELELSELVLILHTLRPQVIVTSAQTIDIMLAAVDSQADRDYFQNILIYNVDLATEMYPSSLETAVPAASRDWKGLLITEKSLAHYPPPKVGNGATRTAAILWTAGTAGNPKGVLLSHQALNFALASLWHNADYYRGEAQRWLGFAPFSQAFGLAHLLFLPICTGSTVFLVQKPEPNFVRLAQCIERHQITYLHMTPRLAMVFSSSSPKDSYRSMFRSVTAGVVLGGAPFSHGRALNIYQRLGFRVRMAYGLTESIATTLQTGTSGPELSTQAGDSGRPLWGVEIMISNSRPKETLQAAETEEEGEIFIRSPGLFSAYLPVNMGSGFGNSTRGGSGSSGVGSSDSGGGVYSSVPRFDISQTKSVLHRDGWFRTGDVGLIDQGGRLHVFDRLEESIRVRALQVSPTELENALCSHPLVSDAAVVGVFDRAEGTEWPRAYVVPQGMAHRDFTTLRDDGRLQSLAQKLRNLIETRFPEFSWLRGGIVFISSMPRTGLQGKIVRRLLRTGTVEGYEVTLYSRRRAVHL